MIRPGCCSDFVTTSVAILTRSISALTLAASPGLVRASLGTYFAKIVTQAGGHAICDELRDTNRVVSGVHCLFAGPRYNRKTLNSDQGLL